MELLELPDQQRFIRFFHSTYSTYQNNNQVIQCFNETSFATMKNQRTNEAKKIIYIKIRLMLYLRNI